MRTLNSEDLADELRQMAALGRIAQRLDPTKGIGRRVQPGAIDVTRLLAGGSLRSKIDEPLPVMVGG